MNIRIKTDKWKQDKETIIEMERDHTQAQILISIIVLILLALATFISATLLIPAALLILFQLLTNYIKSLSIAAYQNEK